MAGAITTLVTASKVIPRTAAGLRGQNRHAYAELEELQGRGDPELAAPYLQAIAVSTIAANGGTSGNLTVTVNFPKYGVAVTTGNIAFDAAESAIQTAIDSALSGAVILATYNAGDVDAGACLDASANTCAVTANGTTVNGAYMVVTTANAGDLDVAAPAVAETAVGTQNRPAQSVLDVYGVISPAGTATPQSGATPADADYDTGDNGLSLSPGLVDLLVEEVKVTEDVAIGNYFRTKHLGV